MNPRQLVTPVIIGLLAAAAFATLAMGGRSPEANVNPFVGPELDVRLGVVAFPLDSGVLLAGGEGDLYPESLRRQAGITSPRPGVATAGVVTSTEFRVDPWLGPEWDVNNSIRLTSIGFAEPEANAFG